MKLLVNVGKMLPGSWIPESVTEIGEQAFFCCYNLTGATIPEGTVSIGDEVFSMDPGSDPNLSVYIHHVFRLCQKTVSGSLISGKLR
ncbi:MAG: leucine-rich repeat protein [Lachnospiraceae bacterium]|nr:leucine-rich repeat protein [Lachnospiraceae bacterium]